MATTTPNFGWPVPTSTDLVKDGATAIEALGDSIDASLLDLKGGTTGQVLSKNSNTDMDFTWVTDAAGDITGVTAGTGISGGGTSGTVTVTNSMATAIDAKGDLIAGTGADAFSRLAIGTNNQVLTADSAEATGLKWATPAAGGMTLINTGGTTLTGASVSITGIPTDTTYKHLLVVWQGVYLATSGGGFYIRPNGNTTAANYAFAQIRVINTTVAGSSEFTGSTYMPICDRTGNVSTSKYLGQAACWIYNYTETVTKGMFAQAYSSDGTSPVFQSDNGGYLQASAISSITTFGDYNFSGGKIYVYGVN